MYIMALLLTEITATIIVLLAAVLSQYEVHGKGLAHVTFTIATPSYYCIIIAEGVTLMLRGGAIADDGYVDADQIGLRSNALMCHTNKTDCCGHPFDRAGHWYFPNGTQVDSYTNNILEANYQFYFRDRRNSVVRLQTLGNPPERGRFYCEVPDANGRNQTVYVNIGMSKSLYSCY